MTTCRLFKIAFPLIVLFLVAFFVVSAVNAAGTASELFFDPQSLGLKPQATGGLTLKTTDVENLYGVEVHIRFDPEIIQVVDAQPAEEGIQLPKPEWLKDGFIAQNRVDNAAGTIDFAATLINPAEPLSGNIAMITIPLQAVKTGISEIKIQKAILATRDGAEIPINTKDSAVQVSSSGKAPDLTVSNKTGSLNSPLVGVALLSVIVFFAAAGFLIYISRMKSKKS